MRAWPRGMSRIHDITIREAMQPKKIKTTKTCFPKIIDGLESYPLPAEFAGQVAAYISGLIESVEEQHSRADNLQAVIDVLEEENSKLTEQNEVQAQKLLAIGIDINAGNRGPQGATRSNALNRNDTSPFTTVKSQRHERLAMTDFNSVRRGNRRASVSGVLTLQKSPAEDEKYAAITSSVSPGFMKPEHGHSEEARDGMLSPSSASAAAHPGHKLAHRRNSTGNVQASLHKTSTHPHERSMLHSASAIRVRENDVDLLYSVEQELEKREAEVDMLKVSLQQQQKENAALNEKLTTNANQLYSDRLEFDSKSKEFEEEVRRVRRDADMRLQQALEANAHNNHNTGNSMPLSVGFSDESAATKTLQGRPAPKETVPH